MLLINLSNKSVLLETFLRKQKKLRNYEVLDLVGNWPNNRNDVIHIPRSWDTNSCLELQSLDKYSEEISKIARSFSKLSLDGFNPFWLTSFAEKYDENFTPWTYCYFLKELMLHDLKTKDLITRHSKIIFVIAERRSRIKSWISSWKQWDLFDNKKISFIFCQDGRIKTYHTFINYFKIILKIDKPYRKLFFSTKKANITCSLPRVLKIKFGSSSSSFIDSSCYSMNDESVEIYLSDGNIFIDKQSDISIKSYIDNKKPKKTKLLFSLLILLSLNFRLISLIFLKPSEKKEYLGLLKALSYEILESTVSSNHIYFFWLKEVFCSLSKKCNILYVDEFYKSGRLISMAKQAANNKRIKSYGLQHAFFGAGHGVYHLSKDECISGLPIPDIFVVWGNYFKRHFQQSLKNKEINIKLSKPCSVFIDNINFGIDKENPAKNRIDEDLRILWCTTTKNSTVKEWDIFIKLKIKSANTKFGLKEHPKVDVLEHLNSFLNPNVKNELNIKKFTNLKKGILWADVVLVSNPSTVFLDVLQFNKPVIILNNLCRIVNAPKEIKELYIANNSIELDSHLTKIRNSTKTLDLSELMTKSPTLKEILGE